MVFLIDIVKAQSFSLVRAAAPFRSLSVYTLCRLEGKRGGLFAVEFDGNEHCCILCVVFDLLSRQD